MYGDKIDEYWSSWPWNEEINNTFIKWSEKKQWEKSIKRQPSQLFIWKGKQR